MRPVPLHREVHPDLDVRDCFGCRVSTVSLGIARLKNDNREHVTQSERGRETVEAARAAGVNAQPTKRWI